MKWDEKKYGVDERLFVRRDMLHFVVYSLQCGYCLVAVGLKRGVSVVLVWF